jgi:hypothetical protein
LNDSKRARDINPPDDAFTPSFFSVFSFLLRSAAAAAAAFSASSTFAVEIRLDQGTWISHDKSPSREKIEVTVHSRGFNRLV